MIEEAFAEAGLRYFANRSGANLMSGVVTEFVMNSTLLGRMKKEYAVIECDEAAAAKVFVQLQPKVIVVTNLFRDQLDRYGEITHTLSNIRQGIRDVPEAILCLNADCSLTASLADDGLPNPVRRFGIDASAGLRAIPAALSDASHCIRCKAEYDYDYHTYAHLGGFRCPDCGYSRLEPDYAVTQILCMDGRHSEVTLRTPEGERPLTVNLPAAYNLYNAAAAVCAAETMGVAPEICLEALGRFSCGFGRMESFPMAGGTRMILVKNPAGCSQALEFLSGVQEEFILAACLNDRGADGTDISWIWDANFELLASLSERLRKLYVSGDRADDMRLRLKYAGIPDERITVEYSPEKLIDALSRETLPVYIIPTYTAMLELRSVIVRRCGGSEFWE
jgi:UDP-N-acetylmuramyl tripeptide synthase